MSNDFLKNGERSLLVQLHQRGSQFFFIFISYLDEMFCFYPVLKSNLNTKQFYHVPDGCKLFPLRKVGEKPVAGTQRLLPSP